MISTCQVAEQYIMNISGYPSQSQPRALYCNDGSETWHASTPGEPLLRREEQCKLLSVVVVITIAVAAIPYNSQNVLAVCLLAGIWNSFLLPNFPPCHSPRFLLDGLPASGSKNGHNQPPGPARPCSVFAHNEDCR